MFHAATTILTFGILLQVQSGSSSDFAAFDKAQKPAIAIRWKSASYGISKAYPLELLHLLAQEVDENYQSPIESLVDGKISSKRAAAGAGLLNGPSTRLRRLMEETIARKRDRQMKAELANRTNMLRKCLFSPACVNKFMRGK